MKQFVLFLILVFSPLFCVWGQEDLQTQARDTTAVVDSLYREDQFYFGVTYNLITNVPDGVRLRGFSGGMRFGFIRDMPINPKRTVAIGVGLGLGFNRYGNTLAITEQDGQTQYAILGDNDNYDSNRFSTSHVEVPIEFRWRSSSPTVYKFYRVHAGVNLSYHYHKRATFVQNGTRFKTTNVDAFTPFQVEGTLLFGYNTMNFYAAYSFTPFFNDTAVVAGQAVGFQPLKLGILFYFL